MIEKIESKEKLRIGKEIIIFIGPEGSGKTTVARRLAEESGKPYLTTGDTLRDLAKNDPGDLGDKARRVFAEHTYLDGDTLLEMLVRRFRHDDTKDGFILDGGLRTLGETIGFRKMLEDAGRSLPITVIHLKIPGWMSFDRLVFGDDARKRSDDTWEGVLGRLTMYYTNLAERIKVIEDQPGWNIVHIDGMNNREKVYEEVCRAVDSKSEVKA